LNNKLRVLHAALVETARWAHPFAGHRLKPEVWRRVFVDRDFQDSCNALVAAKFSTGWFGGHERELPTPEHYIDLCNRHVASLDRWERLGSVRALFYALDAEVALKGLLEGPFLSELVADILMDELQDQVDRGYLKP